MSTVKRFFGKTRIRRRRRGRERCEIIRRNIVVRKARLSNREFVGSMIMG